MDMLPEEYKSSGFKTSLRGMMYQLRFLLLCLSVSLKNNFRRFNLASEIDICHKFDDCVFTFSHDSECRGYFVQIKHKIETDKESQQIGYSSLVREGSYKGKDEFSLVKYMESYSKILAQEELKNVENKKIILCTNATFCEKDRHKIDEILESTRSEFLQSTGSETKANVDANRIRYKMNTYKIKDQAKEMLNKKLKIPLDEQTLDRFVQDFTLVTDLPNEEELGKLLELELGEEIGKRLISTKGLERLAVASLEKQVLHWLKSFHNIEERTSIILTNEYLQNIITDLVNTCNYNTISVLNNTLLYKLRKFASINFDENDHFYKIIENTIVYDNNNNNKIIFLRTNNTTVTSKLVLNVIKNNKITDLFILEIDTITRDRETEMNVLNTFKSYDIINLFIIVCDGNSEEKLRNLYEKLKIIMNDCNKSVVIITKSKGVVDKNVLEHKFSLKQLKNESINTIKNTTVKLQGVDVKIKDVKKFGVKQFINSDVLIDLLDGKLEIGTICDLKSENIYISRTLSQQIISEASILKLSKTTVKNSILLLTGTPYYFVRKIKEKFEDVVYCISLKEVRFEPRNGIIACRDKIQWKTWLKFISKIKNTNICRIYWFQNETEYDPEYEAALELKTEYEPILEWHPGDQREVECIIENDHTGWYTWRGCKVYPGIESLHDISKLLEIRENRDTKSISEDEFVTTLRERSVCLISSDPGYGKSTLLGMLYKKIKTRYSKAWVIRIDLNMFASLDRECGLCNVGADSSAHQKVQLLIDMHLSTVQSKLKSHIDLEKNILEKFLLGRVGTGPPYRLIVFFDGFDEISPGFKNQALSLIKAIIDTKKASVVVTTRPCEKDYLEFELETPAFLLNPFTREEQQEFIGEYRKRHGGSGHRDKYQEIEHLTRQLNITASFKDPLQLTMYCDVVFGDKNTIDKEELDAYTLYDYFTRNKWRIYNREKGLSAEGNQARNAKENLFVDSMNRVHMELAVKYLVPEFKLKLTSFNLLTKRLPNAQEEISRVGFINYNFDNEAIFTHRTFAEFFLANYVIDNINESSSSKLLTNYIFNCDEFAVVRDFIDHRLKHEPEKSKTFVKILEKIYSPVAFLQLVNNNEVNAIKHLLHSQINKHKSVIKKLTSKFLFSDVNTLLVDKRSQKNAFIVAIKQEKEKVVSEILNYVKENQNYTADSLNELLNYGLHESLGLDHHFHDCNTLVSLINLLNEIKTTRTEFATIIDDFLLYKCNIMLNILSINKNEIITVLKVLQLYYTVSEIITCVSKVTHKRKNSHMVLITLEWVWDCVDEKKYINDVLQVQHYGDNLLFRAIDPFYGFENLKYVLDLLDRIKYFGSNTFVNVLMMRDKQGFTIIHRAIDLISLAIKFSETEGRTVVTWFHQGQYFEPSLQYVKDLIEWLKDNLEEPSALEMILKSTDNKGRTILHLISEHFLVEDVKDFVLFLEPIIKSFNFIKYIVLSQDYNNNNIFCNLTKKKYDVHDLLTTLLFMVLLNYKRNIDRGLLLNVQLILGQPPHKIEDNITATSLAIQILNGPLIPV